MDKVTFIVPAYNVEQYLPQTIESVLAQTEQEWKMIIVDDCSSDRTAAIACEYARKDKRIRVMQTECQSGCCYVPRKLAIIAAATEIIAPLDADDAVEPTYLATLLQVMKREESDIVYPRMYAWDGHEKRELLSEFDESLTGKTISGYKALENTLNGWRIHCNGGLIRKELYLKGFDSVNEQDGEIFSYIDEYLTRVLLSRAGKVSIVGDPYLYRENPSSITHQFNIRAFGPYSNNIRIVDFIKSRYPADSTVYYLAQCQNFYGVFEAMRLLRGMQLNSEDKSEVEDLIRKSCRKADRKVLAGKVSRKYYALSQILFRVPVRLGCILLNIMDRMLCR